MILGISSSGRKNGITAQAVKKVLESTGEEYEFISLSGKTIRGAQPASDAQEIIFVSFRMTGI